MGVLGVYIVSRCADDEVWGVEGRMETLSFGRYTSWGIRAISACDSTAAGGVRVISGAGATSPTDRSTA